MKKENTKKFVFWATVLVALALSCALSTEKLFSNGERTVVSRQTQTVESSAATVAVSVAPVGPLAVKAGGKSEKVNILGKRFFVFPELKGVRSDGKGDGIEYELTDIHGKTIIWKDLPRDWKDLKIEWVVICSPKYDLTYIVRDFN